MYLDFADAIKRLGEDAIRERYGNLFEMYERITGENPYEVPMRIYPGRALHDGRALGGLQPDEHDPGLFVLGEANFSDHGANRLGASALMQGLADGYFVIPYTIGDYLGVDEARAGRRRRTRSSKAAEADVAARIEQAARRSTASARSTRSTASSASIMWEYCGMARNAAGLQKALEQIPQLREEFWSERARARRAATELNQALEKAGRVADFLELGELMCRDALQREESCGGHFREEYQTPDGEALRDDEQFAYVAAWEYAGDGQAAASCNKEPLVFENVKLVAAELQVSGR